jgi:uncharacterized protein
VASQAPVPEVVCIAWRRLDSPGHDAATLLAVDDGWRLEGAAVFLESGVPCHLRYKVEVDPQWRTRSAVVQGWFGATRIDVRVNADADHQWLLNGEPAPSVSGSIDIDLAFTPATNLLPIRRLNLSVGSSAPVIAAWLPFPDLQLRPLDQVYRRSAEDAYDYSSSGGTFKAALAVSPAGFVTNYPGLWVQERG